MRSKSGPHVEGLAGRDEILYDYRDELVSDDRDNRRRGPLSVVSIFVSVQANSGNFLFPGFEKELNTVPQESRRERCRRRIKEGLGLDPWPVNGNDSFVFDSDFQALRNHANK
jgi:hypothetical protein